MIYIDNRQDKIELSEEFKEKIKELINYTLKEEKVQYECEISIILIDNETIREINKEERNIDKETDILSFPMLNYKKGKVYKDVYLEYEFDDSYFDEDNLVLGDIAISLEKAKEQSLEYNHPFLREVCYLLTHSVLHLLGYDHMEEEEKAIMRKREEEILNKFNIKRI